MFLMRLSENGAANGWVLDFFGIVTDTSFVDFSFGSFRRALPAPGFLFSNLLTAEPREPLATALSHRISQLSGPAFHRC